MKIVAVKCRMIQIPLKIDFSWSCDEAGRGVGSAKGPAIPNVAYSQAVCCYEVQV